MNRRDFLRGSALIAAGAVAADQLELLDRLGWVRRFFPGWGAPQHPRWDTRVKAGPPLTMEQLNRCFKAIQKHDGYGRYPLFEIVQLNERFGGIEVVRG